MNPVEFELNGAKLKVYATGEIWKFKKYKISKQDKWIQLKSGEHTDKHGYKIFRTLINQKQYTTSRIIYKAFNSEWDIDNIKNNTIDHINRDSLDNRIENLRVATHIEQNLNKDYVINAKGYSFINGKYYAQIRNNCKAMRLGTFDTAEKAHMAYLIAVEKTRN
jgi:hypothetical protein